MTDHISKTADDLIAIFEYDQLFGGYIYIYLFENKRIEVIQDHVPDKDHYENDWHHKNCMYTDGGGVNNFNDVYETIGLTKTELIYLSDDYQDQLTAQLL